MRGFFAPAVKPVSADEVIQPFTLCHNIVKKFLRWELVEFSEVLPHVDP